MVTRILILCTLCFYTIGCNSPAPTTANVQISSDIFILELALDVPSRVKGLMNRTALEKNKGMLFVFTDSNRRSFWMKNCIIPIDLLFLDARGTITALHEMKPEAPKAPEENEFAYDARLSHYWSNGPARFAIELQEGEIKRLGLSLNDRIPIDTVFLQSLAR
jgi:uncharacterized membrane protein (UPF0127 family)